MARRRNTKQQLKKFRERMNLSQADVAFRLHLEGTAMISRWERGETTPSLENAINLSVLYKTFMDQLFPELFTEAKIALVPEEEDIIWQNSRDGP